MATQRADLENMPDVPKERNGEVVIPDASGLHRTNLKGIAGRCKLGCRKAFKDVQRFPCGILGESISVSPGRREVAASGRQPASEILSWICKERWGGKGLLNLKPCRGATRRGFCLRSKLNVQVCPFPPKAIFCHSIGNAFCHLWRYNRHPLKVR